MAYTQQYDLTFINQLNQTCTLEIWEDGGTVVTPVQLTGSSNPVVQRSIDNDDELYTPIRGQELSVEIVTDTIGIIDFLSDEETKWKGIYKVNGDVIFIGFLLQEDSDEDFVDYKHVIRLKFTDSIALLKGVEFRDNAGSYWFDTPTVYQVVKTCLLKTGLSLPIKIYCNIFPSDTVSLTTQSAMNITKINTKTFLVNQRDFMDCYEVLRKIMVAWGCTMYQYKGEWVIDRWSERIEQRTALFNYSTDDTATFVGSGYNVLGIGLGQDVKEVDQPLLFSTKRASRESKLTYRFEKWPELIRNLDFDEGDLVGILSDSTQSTFDLDYFTLVSRTAFRRKELDALGNEKQRYMYIDGAANNLDLNKYVQSQSFPARKGDKIRFSFSASSKNDLGTTAALVYVKCGSYYLDDDGKWYTSAVFLRLDFAAAENSTEWKSYEVESAEIPVDGDMEVRFLLMQGCAVGNETRYKDVTIEYIDVINGKSAKGDINNYPNPVTTKNPVNEQVYVSDSPLKIFRGALLKSSGALETSWKRGGETETRRFTQLNSLGYYQSRNRAKIKPSGTFRGTFFSGGFGDFPIGFYLLYSFYDIPNKLFALTSLNEINWFTGIWRGSFVEVNDSVIDATIITPPPGYVYNYIFE